VSGEFNLKTGEMPKFDCFGLDDVGDIPFGPPGEDGFAQFQGTARLMSGLSTG
jgi:hypothetical protein